MNYNVEEHDKSKFDGTLSVIYRLDLVHRHLHNAWVERNEDLIFRWLENFYIEIVGVLTGSKDKRKDSEDIMKLWYDAKKDYFNIKNCKAKNKPINESYFDSMREMQINLKILETKYGLGISKKEGARDALR